MLHSQLKSNKRFDCLHFTHQNTFLVFVPLSLERSVAMDTVSSCAWNCLHFGGFNSLIYCSSVLVLLTSIREHNGYMSRARHFSFSPLFLWLSDSCGGNNICSRCQMPANQMQASAFTVRILDLINSANKRQITRIIISCQIYSENNART